MRNGVLTLAGGSVLTFVLGSIHAFSVFVEAWENLLGASRADVSLTYSFALAALTASVLLGHRIYTRLAPPVLALAICFVAAAGAIIASAASSLPVLWLGYSLLFGAANGAGYGFALQIAAQAMPTRKGLAMGLVTACYAAGAAVASGAGGMALDRVHVAGAMQMLAAVLALAAIIVAVCFRLGGARYEGEAKRSPAVADTRVQLLLWAGYGTASMAGLMAIGHAVGIVVGAGATVAAATAGPIVVSLCNMGGAVTAGWMAGRVRLTSLMIAVPLVSSAALLLLALSPGVALALGALAFIGFAYGAIITLYPLAVAERFGPAAAARIYGRVFIAWGLAGLAGPWTAGLLYDRAGDYSAATLLAAAVGLISILCVRLLPRHPSSA